MTATEPSLPRPEGDHGNVGEPSQFRGRSGGPPARDLEVRAPRLDQFGLTELGRMIVVYVVLITRILTVVAIWAGWRRGRSVWSAASHGAWGTVRTGWGRPT